MTNIVPQKPRKRNGLKDALAKQTPGYVEPQPEPVAESKTFSLELAQQFLESDEQFPVNFDDAWEWLGYTRKDSALKTLKGYFVSGDDFTLRQSAEWRQGGRSGDVYLLTANCLKEFGMVAKTAQGKLIRKYFLQCEQLAKKAIAQSVAPPVPQLPGDIRLDSMIKNLDRLELDLLNPRFKQGLQDLAADMLGISQPRLEAEKTADRDGVWCGVVERAEQLGYPVGLLIEKRTALGRWVAKSALDSQKEVRLCNGTQRPINVYRVTDELDRAIVTYFDKLNVKP